MNQTGEPKAGGRKKWMRISVPMRPEMEDRFKARAEKSLRSLGREISILAEKGLEAEEKKCAETA